MKLATIMPGGRLTVLSTKYGQMDNLELRQDTISETASQSCVIRLHIHACNDAFINHHRVP